MTDQQQLTLLPDAPPDARIHEIPLDLLPPDADLNSQPPTAELIESVKVFGVQHPPTVRELVVTRNDDKGPYDATEYEVIGGRRRIKAARAAGLERIRVVVLGLDETPARLLAIQLNSTATDNPLADVENLLAVAELLRAQNMTERAIEKELSKRTGLSRSALWARLQFRHLNPAFMAAVRERKVGLKVAEQIAKLPDDLQGELVLTLQGNGKVTKEDVRTLRRAQSQTTQVGFDPGQGVDFNVTAVIPPAAPARDMSPLMKAIQSVLDAPKGHDKASSARRAEALEALRLAHGLFGAAAE